jgi:hypothetical protein
MTHVFVSYSHVDRDYARQLAQALEREGFDVWADDRIDYGATWPQVIQDKLDTSSAVVLLMTPAAAKSKWVNNELSRALRKDKPLFPMLLEGDEPWLLVESIEYVDVTDRRLPSRSFYDHLARSARRRSKRGGASSDEAATPPTDPRQRKNAEIQKALDRVVNRHETWQVGLFEVHEITNQIGIYLYAEVKDLDRLDIHAPAVAREYRKFLTDKDIQAERRRRDRANEPDKSDPAWMDWVLRSLDPGNWAGEANYLKEIGVKFLWYPSSDGKELPSVSRELVQANMKLGLAVDLISVQMLRKTPPL